MEEQMQGLQIADTKKKRHEQSLQGNTKLTKTNIKHSFRQPVKVRTIKPLPSDTDVGAFVEDLYKDKEKEYYRGFKQNIQPMTFDTPKPANHTRFVCVSDTHNLHDLVKVPDGDVLLHAGDFTEMGKLHEVDAFNEWLGKLKHKHKVVIAGNHELSFDAKIMNNIKSARMKNQHGRFGFLGDIPEDIWTNWKARLSNCVYLEDELVEINGIKIYGSPWQPEFFKLGFNEKRGKNILKKWDKIPDNIDILLTHGPPAGRLDRVHGKRAGCIELLNTMQLRVQPKYHVFGHIHENGGYETDMWTRYINAAIVDHSHKAKR